MRFWVLSALLFGLSTGAAGAAVPQPIATPVTTLEAGASSESLTHGRGVWSNAYLVYVHRSAPRAAVYGMISQNSRFGKSDLQYMTGVYLPASANTIFNLEMSLSPTHQVLPNGDISAALDHRLKNGFGFTIGTDHRAYRGLDVQGESVLVDRYWGSERAAYKLSAVQLSNVGGFSLTHSALYTHYYGIHALSQITVTLSAGRDVENVGPGVLVSSVASASLGGAHWFEPGWALTWNVSATRQGTIYSRSGIQFGLRRRI